MDSKKFDQMVREFPFITKILADANLSKDEIGYFTVKRVDRNLFVVTPQSWAHDVGSLGEHNGYRHFWCVSSEDVISLKSSYCRSQVPHGTTNSESADLIGIQLLKLNRDVQFIVEIHVEYWDFEADKNYPEFVIYKMKDFNWRRFCQLQDSGLSEDTPDPFPCDGMGH